MKEKLKKKKNEKENNTTNINYQENERCEFMDWRWEEGKKKLKSNGHNSSLVFMNIFLAIINYNIHGIFFAVSKCKITRELFHSPAIREIIFALLFW